ncbi:MAG: DUF2190 family protein [Burkholderiales bacterium]|nr:DUF2190 family protein [Burkholderiales bacterium]
MSGIRNPVYYPFLAGASVGPNRLVKIGAADQTVIPGAAAADVIVGVSAQSITTATGERVDVVMSGVYEVVAGGSVTRGAPICSDAAGAGVVSAPAAGTNNGIVGFALEAAASGDLFACFINPSVRQG